MTTYEPIQSIWHGDDASLLEKMLEFYPKNPPEIIIDMTANARRFWKHSNRQIITVDKDPQFNPDYCCDNKATPFADFFADVLIYDPPHLLNADKAPKTSLGVRFAKNYGLVNTEYISGEFDGFFKEAFRVLKPDGVCFCKIADFVHNHRYQWQHLDLIAAAMRAGFTACDCIVKVRKQSILSGKWKKAHHARSHHCYWIVLRKGDRCE